MQQQVPGQDSEAHMAISQTAAKTLGHMIDGNGLRAEQARVAKQDTHVHKIEGRIAVTLKPDVVKTPVKGKNPAGQVMGSEGEIFAQAENLGGEMLRSHDIQQEILRVIAKDKSKGFGIENIELPINAVKKTFSTVDKCHACDGNAVMACNRCNHSGRVLCGNCQGQGMMPCQSCFGSGQIQQADGSHSYCSFCQGNGLVSCTVCAGQKLMTCPTCKGKGETGCTDCGQTGFWTNNYDVSWQAKGGFEQSNNDLPPDVLKIVSGISLVGLGTGGYAEISSLPPQIEGQKLIFPLTALFPVAKVDFSVEGKIHTATIAGLHGKIIEIDPFLDTVIKPGINALYKLSKGPMAFQALVDQACKYRIIRDTISGISRDPKKKVYQKLIQDYSGVLSDKYARALIKYTSTALELITAGTRKKALIAGTLLSALIAGGYYLTPLRDILHAPFGRYIIIADVAVWIAGFTAALFLIKIRASKTLHRILPQTVKVAATALPAAGVQGYWAFLTSFIVSSIVAGFAKTPPDWIAALLQKF